MVGAVMLNHFAIPRLLHTISWPIQSQAERTVGRTLCFKTVVPKSLR